MFEPVARVHGLAKRLRRRIRALRATATDGDVRCPPTVANSCQASSTPAATGATPPKKELQPPPMTPLEKMLQDSSAIREDGSDKFFGMENVSGIPVARR